MYRELFNAIYDKNNTKVDELLRDIIKKGKININDIKNDFNLIETAILVNNLEAVKLLLKYGIDINRQNVNDNTPLMFALKTLDNDDRIVLLLLNEGANINIEDEEGKKPLDIAREYKYNKIIQLLEKKQEEIKKLNQLQNTVKKNAKPEKVQEFTEKLAELEDLLQIFVMEIEPTNAIAEKKDKFIVSVIGFLYFLDKYKNSCSPVEFITLNDEFYTLVWTCETNTNKRILKHNKNFNKRYKLCLKNKNIRFIICLLSLKYKNGCRGGDSFTHANVLIHDKQKRTLERFEPNGSKYSSFSTWFESNECDKYIKKVFMVDNDFDIDSYLPTVDICPIYGFQLLQSYDTENEDKAKYLDGYCAIWSQFYINLRLQFPDVPQMKLLEKTTEALRSDSRSYTRFIQDYIRFIRKISLKFALQFKDPVTGKSDPIDNLNRIVKQIHKDKLIGEENEL